MGSEAETVITDRPTSAGEARPVPPLLDRLRPALRARSIYAVRHVPEVQVKLNQNESPYDLPDALKAEAARRLLERPWNRYPTDYADPLRAAVAEHVGLLVEQVLLSNGSNDLINTVGLALIDDGTPVVLEEPLFSLYPKAVALYGGTAVSVRRRADFTLDAGAVLAAARKADAPLIVLTVPNAPTGRSMPFADVERLAAEAPGFVLIDEAYHEFVDAPSAIRLIDRYPNVLVLRTFSKAVGLAGLRLGYLAADARVLLELQKARLPFVINQLTEAVALTVLDHPGLIAERVARIRADRVDLEQALQALPDVEVVPSETNFIIFRTPLASARLVERLAARGVLIRDVGSYPMLERYVRVSVGRGEENQAFLQSLKHVLYQETAQVRDGG